MSACLRFSINLIPDKNLIACLDLETRTVDGGIQVFEFWARQADRRAAFYRTGNLVR
jgi:hypothetical protein